MIDHIQKIISEFSQKHADTRLHVCKIEVISYQSELLKLGGLILESDNLNQLIAEIKKLGPYLVVETDQINILRKSTNATVAVGTNLTSLHASSSFLSEMSSQLVFGEHLEILSEQGNWVYTRQNDGYLGWTYKPYLTANLLPIPTHIVLSPVAELYAQPATSSEVLTRIFCGTKVSILSTSADWVHVSANLTGWMKSSNLRAFSDFPQTAEACRDQMLLDGQRMIGVPYLWGGSSGNGIDCSGFARLMLRWVGIEIPRDADMQSIQSRRMEPPYKAGDLFFFGEGDSQRRITHVGVCMGGMKVLHSSRSRNGVYLDDLDKRESLRNIFAHAGSFMKE